MKPELDAKIVKKMNENWPTDEELKDFRFSTHGRPVSGLKSKKAEPKPTKPTRK